jgi:hypothetical protein
VRTLTCGCAEHKLILTKGRMRYLIGLMAITLVGCASSPQPPAKHTEDKAPARPSFAGHWNNEDPSPNLQPANLDIHPDGTFSSVDHEGTRFTGKWTATSETAATFTVTEDNDSEVVAGQLSGNDEMIIRAPGETPMTLKRQH